MTLDPLGWTAAQFLTFYVVLVVLAGIWIQVLRRRIGPPPQPEVVSLGLLETAWLAGGWHRAADTVLIGMLNAGTVTIDTSKRKLSFSAGEAQPPPAISPFGTLIDGTRTRKQAHSAFRQDLELTGTKLAELGLVPRPEEILQLAWATAGVLSVPLVIGMTRLFAGISRGRPVGYLVFLLFITALAGLMALCRPPRVTRAGSAALLHETTRNARAARAPLLDELPLAFALSGAAVLAGTPYEIFSPLIPKSDGGGGGGCGGGGGGGGCGGGG